MCDPYSIALGVVGLAASAYGGISSANAASSAAKATQQANLMNTQAQNNAFQQRIAAAGRQTDAQTAANTQMMSERNTAAALMRQQQSRALEQSQQNLAQENRTAEDLRQQGDVAAQDLLQQTTAQQQAAAQAQRETQQGLLLDQNLPAGPDPGSPLASDESKTALARRLAEASTNVRDYGSKIAKASAYEQPLLNVALAINQNKAGIMPAQAAETLLRTGAPVRALPSQIAFRTAGAEGGAQDELLRAKGQSALDTAGLEYSNAVSLANLGQANVGREAENMQKQAQADAAYKQAIGGLFSQLGQLGLYGAGMRGFGSLAGAGTGAAQAAINAGEVAPPGSFSYRGL